MVLLAIVKLIKKNDLTPDEVTFINDDCLKSILEYTFVKYPQSLETEKNKELDDLVTQRDNIADPQNDQVHRSGVKFELKKDGEDYNEEIMKFFNYLIQMLN